MRFALLKILLVISVLFFQYGLSAQTTPAVYSARAMGLADAGMALQDINALYYNQAGLVHLDKWAVQANASRRFELSELSQVNLAFGKKLSEDDVLFASVRRFGFTAYNESVLTAGYGRRLSSDLSIAAQFNLYQFRIEGYGSTSTPGYEIALQQTFTRDLIVGLKVVNPIPFSEPEGIVLPSLLSIGAGYRVSDQVMILAEVEKDANFEARAKIAVEYAPAEAFRVRVGGSSGPGMFHGGVGYVLDGGLSIDLAAAYHQLLGLTPAVGISYTPK